MSIVFKATEDKGEMGKGSSLIVSKKRLAPDALQLRSVLTSTNRMTIGGGGIATRKNVPGGFVEVRRLQPIQRKGETVIEVVLSRRTALRSYVLRDFRAIYEKRAFVIIMDGGLSLTYDLPAFVEGLPPRTRR